MRSLVISADVDWIPGSETGVDGLLDLCARKGIAGSFFFTGGFARDYPERVRAVRDAGHDIGTHGWEHGLDPAEDYRLRSRDDQREWIRRFTDMVEQAAGLRPRMFRAPNLSVSETALALLDEEGYEIDSSVPALRYDMGVGAVSYTKYFRAPVRPYHPDPDHLGRVGVHRMVEVPPSAFIIPINMSALRRLGLGAVLWAVRLLSLRSPLVVFYLHPAEFCDASSLTVHPDEPPSSMQSIGPGNFTLLERFIDSVVDMGYTPQSLSAVVERHRLDGRIRGAHRT